MQILRDLGGRVVLGEGGFKGDGRIGHFGRRWGNRLRWQEIDTVTTYSTLKQMLLGCVVIHIE